MDALANNKILLSPWELLCFTLFKTIASQTPFCGNADEKPLFSSISEKDNFDDQRLDKHRIMTIVVVSMFKQLVDNAKAAVDQQGIDV